MELFKDANTLLVRITFILEKLFGKWSKWHKSLSLLMELSEKFIVILRGFLGALQHWVAFASS